MNDNRVEIPGSIVACESLDVREDLAVGGTLSVGGSPVGGIAIENAGVPLAGGPFTTQNLLGLTGVDAGGGKVNVTALQGNAGMFGTGRDGNLNFDGVAAVASPAGTLSFNLVPVAGVYTLTRDVYANNLTVAVGAVIKTAGWRIFVAGTLTLNGNINCNGGNGVAGTAGAGGAAGTAQPTQILYGGRNGTAGTNPTATGAAGGVPANTHMGAGTALVPGTGGAASNGGIMQGGGGGRNELGLDGGTVAASGTGGAVNAPTMEVLAQALTGKMLNLTQLETASSGAVGRPGSGVGTGGSGGSGASGGTVIVAARVITGAGSIEAKGGDAGAPGGTASGGSGGGGGGAVVVCTTSQSPLSVTLSAAGGLGSAAGGLGGTTAGGNGGAGMVYLFAGQ